MFEVAEEKLQEIVRATPSEDDLPLSEANTRLKLIDPILTDVLGWSRAEGLWVELHAGNDRLDYLVNWRSWRLGAPFPTSRRKVSLTSLVGLGPSPRQVSFEPGSADEAGAGAVRTPRMPVSWAR